MATLTARDYRAIMLYNFQRGLPKSECHEEMKRVFQENCPSLRTIERWYKQFQRGLFKLEDDARTGRPVEVKTETNISRVGKIISENRHVTYREIQHMLRLHAPTVHEIIHKHLRMRKVCSLFVPHLLTEAQRNARVSWCRQMLKTFESGTSTQVNSIVTGDETWLYYYDMPTKSQSKIWLCENEEPATKIKTARSVKKRMIVVFFGKRGIIKTVLLDTQKTVTASWYVNICLPQVIEALKNLRPKSRLDTWWFHHDNAPAHRSQQTMQFLQSSGLKLLEHPPYSPDLAPCDFGFFPYVKKQLKGRRFTTEDALIGAFQKICDSIPTDKWNKIFDDWFVRIHKCINCSGKYFEKI